MNIVAYPINGVTYVFASFTFKTVLHLSSLFRYNATTINNSLSDGFTKGLENLSLRVLGCEIKRRSRNKSNQSMSNWSKSYRVHTWEEFHLYFTPFLCTMYETSNTDFQVLSKSVKYPFSQ